MGNSKGSFIKANLTRRSFMKAAGLLGASTVLPACSTSMDAEKAYPPDASQDIDKLVMDKDMRYFMSTGPHNCGMRCVHKIHVNKFGRAVHFTSAGDIERGKQESFEKDESIRDVQKRACVRGYSYIKRYYQPDRLKYPMIQTKERGNPKGFKRISWDEALDYVASKLNNAKTRAQDLGYLPVKAFWDVTSIFKGTQGADGTTTYPLGYPAMAVYGNASFGNIAAALWDSVGYDSPYNASADMLNSELILCWSVDVTSSFGHQGASYWFYNKAKEAGVPIVVIDVKYSDTAASFGTGAKYSGPMGAVGEETNRDINIPGWVAIRPGTDAAMTAAMSYVIYKGKGASGAQLIDEEFLKTKVFGFYPNDTITSAEIMDIAPDFIEDPNMALSDMFSLGSGNYFHPMDSTTQQTTSLPYKYTAMLGSPGYTVPAGESFSEYLEAGMFNDAGFTNIASMTDSEKYNGILSWAEEITGVKAEIIEAIARLYAVTPAARLDGGGGPQREFNGMYYAWMNIALAAMTGKADKKGGGPGYSMFNEAGTYLFGHNYLIGSGNRLPPKDQILVSIDKTADLIFKKKDGRTNDQIKNDFMHFHGINNPNGEIEVDMLVNCANHLCSMPNTNKLMLAMTNKKAGTDEYLLKDIITIEHFMTPTAMYSDIVLPAAMHWEKEGIGLYTMPDLFYMQKIFEPAWEAKPDELIWHEVGKRMGVFEGSLPPEEDGLRGFYSILQISEFYRKEYPNATKPTFEEFKAKGHFNLPIDPEKAFVGLRDIHPLGSRATSTTPAVRGRIGTTTGLINLWSPFYGEIRPDRILGADNQTSLPAGPRYISNPEGYEMLMKDPSTIDPQYKRRRPGAETYPLQLLTDKPKNRAHTVFDNVAVIKEQFPQTCKINPMDASERGILNGEMLYAYNDRGCVRIPAEITDRTPPGVIRIQHGAWYRPHPTEKVTIWQDLGNGVETIEVPVDSGGCENILTLDLQNGPRDPYIGGSIYVQGCLCDISKVKPE